MRGAWCGDTWRRDTAKSAAEAQREVSGLVRRGGRRAVEVRRLSSLAEHDGGNTEARSTGERGGGVLGGIGMSCAIG